MCACLATQTLLNHIEETSKAVKNERKLMQFIIRNKRNYHRGRIRFRHLMEVSRKHKRTISSWHSFSLFLSKQVGKQNIESNASSIIAWMDKLGQHSKVFMDVIMKCASSFIDEYLLSGHDVNFCYYTVSILGRLYALYASRLSQMADARKIVFVSANDADPKQYATIYWNDFEQFAWPQKFIRCQVIDCGSTPSRKKKKQTIACNAFDKDVLCSIGADEMKRIVKEIDERHLQRHFVDENVTIENEQQTAKSSLATTPQTQTPQNNDETKSGNKRSAKKRPRKRAQDKVKQPALKKQKTMDVKSTFELMQPSTSDDRSKHIKKKQRKTDNIQPVELDAIDEIFGDLD